jgi:hypothetical protein
MAKANKTTKASTKKAPEKKPSKATKVTKNTKAVAKPTKITKKTKVSKTVTKKAPTKKAGAAAAGMCGACVMEAAQDKAFWVNNGPIVSTLDGLRDALRSMSDEQFDYHTKRAGNDFAKWVNEVLCHGACASKLGTAKTRTSAVRAIATCQCA